MSVQSITRLFDRKAPHYAEHAAVQLQIVERFIDWLDRELRPKLADDYAAAPCEVLEVGVGTGLLTAQLLNFLPQLRLTALDISAQMLNTARQQLSHSKKCKDIQWVIGDIASYHSPLRYDLIVSSSCLHWCPSLAAAFKCIQRLLKPGRYFAFCLMSEGTLTELHTLRQKLFVNSMPQQLLPSAAEVRDLLIAANFQLLHEESFPLSERHESAVSFFHSLSERGTTGPGVFTGAKPLTRNQLALLAEQYQRSYPHPAGGVLASYNVSAFIVGV